MEDKTFTRGFNPDDILIKVGETVMDWKNETLSEAMNRELKRIEDEKE